MHRKLTASLMVTIFLLSIFAVMVPAPAHFTLGNLTGTYRYHEHDFDPHVSGVIGYVWPGSGYAAYTGTANGCPPGYQSPYPGGNPSCATANQLQLESDTFAPFGSVLTNSTGDLIFAINATSDFSTAGPNGSPPIFFGWSILIPPEFTVPDTSQVVSTITNNQPRILITQLSPNDAYAPGWTRLNIGADGIGLPGPAGLITFGAAQHANEWYYVRVNGVIAPSVAGRYFFKMFLDGTGNCIGRSTPGNPEGVGQGWSCVSVGVSPATGNSGSGAADNYPGQLPAGNYWVPPENWPVMLVKGEVDPAIITGTVRYGGFNATLYQQPVQEAGKVWASMTMRIDPYTGQQRPDLALINAVGYLNATAQGHFEVEGLAPGIYSLYAEVAGYPQQLCSSNVSVLKGQSLHFDCYLQPGPVIHGNVFTKHQFGEEPWPAEFQFYPGLSRPEEVGLYMKIELYSNPTLSSQVDPSAGAPVSYSPLPCIAGGWNQYSPGYDASLCGDPRRISNTGQGIEVAFPWHEYTEANGYSNSPTQGGAGLTQSTPGVYSDPQGVGPPQTWVTAGGTTTPFHFEFGVKGEYGAPTDLDGHVPQIFATWVNGLTPGRYYVRAWTFRYVQTALDGATFQENYFDVSPDEWAGDVTLPIDLRLSSWVNKTVYFHNLPGTIVADGINTGANFLICALYDMNTSARIAYNVTYLPEPAQTGSTYPNHGPLDPANLNQFCNTPGRPEFGHCNIQLWGYNDTWLGQNYGIPSGSYNSKVWALGYLQQTTEVISVTLSGNPTSVSDHLYRGVGLNLTVYSIDWERPRVGRNWVYGGSGAPVGETPGADIEVGIYINNTSSSNNFVMEVCTGCDASGPSGDIGTTGNSYYDRYYNGFIPRTVQERTGGTYNLNQDFSTDHLQADGGGTNVLPSDNAQGAFFGAEVPYALVGGEKSRTGGLYTGFTTAHSFAGRPVVFWRSAALDSGQYGLLGWTMGYIQDKDFTAYAERGQVLDMKINLVIGVNVTLQILFKKESIITPTLNPLQARVRLYNDQGMLVADWMSSEGVDLQNLGDEGIPDHNALACTVPQEGTGDQQNQCALGEGVNYVPGGVSLLTVPLNGLPAYFGSLGDPIFTRNSADFEVDYWPSSQALFPHAGIAGTPDYTGGWTAEVDFVNIYNNNTYPFPSVNFGGPNTVNNFYPPVNGLLMGESYHIIPGTTATSGISLTEDAALNSTFVGHSMAPNHLGPYSQRGVWQIVNAHLGGEASAVFEIDLNGLVSGNALAFTWSNEFRTLSWGTVSVTSASGATWNFYTYDGIYEAFLPTGTYKFTITTPGYESQTWSVSVSSGQTGTGQNLYLEQNNIPVPEFSAVALVAFSALASSLGLLRRRRK